MNPTSIHRVGLEERHVPAVHDNFVGGDRPNKVNSALHAP